MASTFLFSLLAVLACVCMVFAAETPAAGSQAAGTTGKDGQQTRFGFGMLPALMGGMGGMGGMGMGGMGMGGMGMYPVSFLYPAS